MVEFFQEKLSSLASFLSSIGKQKSEEKNEEAEVDGVKIRTHYKCRNAVYGGSDVQRFAVPDDKVSWRAEFPDYDPPYYVSEKVHNPNGEKPVWADHESIYDGLSPAPEWNTICERVDRRSHTGKYEIDKEHGVPINPVGRTGIIGRGLLGRWGPNHAADPIVTRWKRNEEGEKIYHEDGKPILQFVSIERRDTGEWAIPGGMVDPGEQISITLKREFAEEAMNVEEAGEDERGHIDQLIAEAFESAKEVYRGYVDDPRNTDNSWMETVAVNAHDDTGKSVGKFKLHAGDDAAKVCWTDLDSNLKLYASHAEFLKSAARLHDAHW